MTGPIHRRHFLGTAAAAGLASGLTTQTARASRRAANDTITIGIMGTGGRGSALAQGFQGQDGVEVAYVCDVDHARVERVAQAVAERGGRTPKAVGDFRHILDDDSVDALVVATCNHWHAPAAILGCAAGKHVYVEKPCSHNPHEGELLVKAARRYDRKVQMGNQRRTWPKVQEAIARVQKGDIGRAYFARCTYLNARPSIGNGKEAPVPEGLDYAMWEGPAPHRPYHDNYLHYNWHWFWHWGNGELGNNGIHFIDVARWGLGVGLPVHVTSGGGRYHFPEDDQETPDTQVATYDYDGDKSITWIDQSCNPFQPGGRGSEIIFYGTDGALAITGGGYTIYDLKGKELDSAKGPAGDPDHLANFLGAIRGEADLNSEIGEGHVSTLLCHLGNIAHRTGRALKCDPKDGRILDDQDAMSYWSREYAPGWEPKV